MKTRNTQRKRPAASCAGVKIIDHGKGASLEVRGPLAGCIANIARREGVPAAKLVKRILLQAFVQGPAKADPVVTKSERPGSFAEFLCAVGQASLSLARNNLERCQAEAVSELLWRGHATVGTKPFFLPHKRRAK